MVCSGYVSAPLSLSLRSHGVLIAVCFLLRLLTKLLVIADWRTVEIAPQVAALHAAHWEVAPTASDTLLQYAIANYGAAAGNQIAPVLMSMDSFIGGPVHAGRATLN